MNFMRDESVDGSLPDRNDLLVTAMAPLAYANKNSNATIKNFIDDPAWGNNDVGSALNKASAVATNIGLLDHGQPELPL